MVKHRPKRLEISQEKRAIVAKVSQLIYKSRVKALRLARIVLCIKVKLSE